MHQILKKTRVGADIGGTFTDLVLIDEDGGVIRKKVPSTTGNYAQGIVNALDGALADGAYEPAAVSQIVHGTTVATNTILEQTGAVCGLIATKGFRDILELRRLRMPQLYRLDWQKPPVLARRDHRLEVTERIAADGSVLVPLDTAELAAVGRQLVEAGVEAISIAFLNSYANPAHEREAALLLRELFPQIPISVSTEILPEIQEYERTSTTVVNSYVQPRVKSYLESLRGTLNASGVGAPLLIMQSNGGLMTSRAAGESPVRIIESGPAAGVIACREIAQNCGYANMICFDMGGTTAKASLIENAAIQQATEYEVGGGVSAGSRLNRGGGYVVRAPSIDIAEVGAGGGSLVSIDKVGGIQVGPSSAGAVPGPVCYQKGNAQPTVTDANVTLGYISPVGIAGGSLTIDAGLAREAIGERVSSRIGQGVDETAFGIHTIANANMIRALRSVTVERGRDPSEFSLCAFGGSGPVHAAHVAREMDIDQVIIPPCPGLFSAFGLLLADIERHYSQSVRQALASLPADELDRRFKALEDQARDSASDPEHPIAAFTIARSLDLRYRGQVYSLTIEVDGDLAGPADIERIRRSFKSEYQKTYGFEAPGEAIDIEAMRVVIKADATDARDWFQAAARADAASAVSQPSRQAYFGPDFGWMETPIVSRDALQREPRRGPFVIEGYDATTVVPPDFEGQVDAWGNIILNRKTGGA
ncbi:hydantoinase/oxoprolinase family protein [Bosea sp. (in: a-proteobacteria)]|uniref:hydantoinase/oxoprolinase family protein n=1 Tax=Bosea sp. (in: a-proteobacteria) TaxID=1871050 RepID=UPI00260FEB26|nr:hydantoinase/oxoprolinase family protein [Bosea sp. (in: a-proteobacteria)]MCO5089821.1 hydantoinase/oxoprolinase family protein [Bosea sp. (in: a-proteobacteria)]